MSWELLRTRFKPALGPPPAKFPKSRRHLDLPPHTTHLHHHHHPFFSSTTLFFTTASSSPARLPTALPTTRSDRSAPRLPHPAIMSGRMYPRAPRTESQPLRQSPQCICHEFYQAPSLIHHPRSPFPRLGEAVHPSHPRGPGPRDQGPLPAAHSMDRRDSGHFLGHEADAALRHCLFRLAGTIGTNRRNEDNH